MSNQFSETVVTEDAIIIVRKRSNARMFEDYRVTQKRLKDNFVKSLEFEAQSIRSEKLKSTGELISTTDSLLAAQRERLSQIVYFDTLRKD